MRFLWLAVLLMAWAGNVAADTRGINVRVKDTGGTTVALYAESHALVIGISDYTKGWPSLRGVREDIPAVKTALEQQGFAVTVVTDPDRDGLDRAFRDFISHHGQRPDNRLLFYFAGHGHSMKLGYGGMMGYLVGRDAPNPRVDKVGFKNKALSMQVIETYARNIESKHALFVFDACFAGSVFDATRAIPEVIRAKTGKPVRQFITSGTAEQQVPDRSVFRRQFVAALGGEGDLDGDGYVTGAELGQFLETTVTNYTRRSQTPQYGKLRDPLLDKGDFVFALPTGARPTATPAPSQPAGPNMEALFWQSIQGGTNPAEFEAYLRQFPNGTFASLARLKLDALKEPEVAPPTPPPVIAGPTPDLVREAQRLLTNLGYSPGPVDGKAGPGTKVAVVGFQRDSGLEVDGDVSEDLVAALRDAGQKAEAERQERVEAARRALMTARLARLERVEAARRALMTAPGTVFRDCEGARIAMSGASLGSGIFCGPEMVVIPSGNFRMGDLSGGGDSNEKPIHTVTIPHPFAVGKYEVTQAEWQAVMGSNPSRFKGSRNPVEEVSWDDAKAFVRKLNARTGKTYRLLSEAEWEYVARAGTSTKYWWGNGITSSQAKFNSRDGTVPVGSYRSNAFGVYDTVGNVYEWTEDCWHDNYNGAPADGSAWTTGGNCSRRVLRGGSQSCAPRIVRSAIRGRFVAGSRGYSFGFRVARTF